MKLYPVTINGYTVGKAHTTQEAREVARPFVGHSDFEAFFSCHEAPCHYDIYIGHRLTEAEYESLCARCAAA